MSHGVVIDARGMRCPWPVLRLAKAMRAGERAVTIKADDPIAPGEIRALADQHGWRCEEIAGEDCSTFHVEAATE